MIDLLINKVILAITTFVKRHPGVTILILFLLWIVPTLVAVMSTVARFFSRWNQTLVVGNWIVKFAQWIFYTGPNLTDVGTASAAGAAAGALDTPKGYKPVWWILVYGIAVINPLFGAVLAVWSFIDRYKTPAPSSPAPSNQYDTPEPTARESFSRYKYGL